MRVLRLGALLAALVLVAGCAHDGSASHVLPSTMSGQGGSRAVRTPGQPLIVQSVSASNVAGGAGNALSVSFSAAPTPGHTLIAGVMYVDSTGARPMAPAGWRLVAQTTDGANAGGIAVFTRLVAAGDGAGPYAFRIGTAGTLDPLAVSLKELAHVDPANPVDIVTTNALANGTSMALPAATPSRAEATALAYFNQRRSGQTPSGFTPGAGWQVSDQMLGANSDNAAQVQVLSSLATSTTAPLAASESWNGTTAAQTAIQVVIQPKIPPPAAGTLAIVQSMHATSVNSASVSGGLTSPPVMGNQLVAAVMWSDSASEPVSAPAGWTLVDHVEHSNYVGISVFTKTVDGTDTGAPYTFGTASQRYFSLVIDEIQGADAARAVNAFGGNLMNGGYSALAQTNAVATASGGLQLAFFNQYNGGAHPSAFVPASGFAQRDVIYNPSGEQVAEQTVGNAFSTAGVGASTSESWQQGENSVSVSEMIVLAPAPGATLLWSIGDYWQLLQSDGQGPDAPVFASAPAGCDNTGQCTGGTGPVSFHLQRPSTAVPAAEYRNMMFLEKWDPVKQYAFDYQLQPGAMYDVRFQTVYRMAPDAPDVQSLLWQLHWQSDPSLGPSQTGVGIGLGVVNRGGSEQFFFNPAPVAGNNWYGPTSPGGVDTWEIQFRNAQDSTGWLNMYRNGTLQVQYTGPTVGSTYSDLISFGLYYYDWEIQRSTILSTDMTFNFMQLSSISGPVPPTR